MAHGPGGEASSPPGQTLQHCFLVGQITVGTCDWLSDRRARKLSLWPTQDKEMVKISCFDFGEVKFQSLRFILERE